MKKYLNKGLIYEWFNAGKAAIFIGLITWGFVAHSILKSNIFEVKRNISSAYSSSFFTTNLEEYYILAIIFLGIYIFANGVSKRNTAMFLCSGPYTKKQIKINELICLFITLILFIFTYVYITITIYIKYSELLSIIRWFPNVILIEVVRLLLFGILGILLMLTIDLLFSNTIMAYLGMIALAIVSIGMIIKTFMIIKYFARLGSVMPKKIFGRIDSDGTYYRNLLFSRETYNKYQPEMIIKGIIVLIIVIGIAFIIFNVLEKRARLETSGKIFSSRTNEKIIVTYLSLGVGVLTNFILTQRYVDSMLYRTGEYQPLVGLEIFKMLSIDMVSIAIVAFISYKIFKKILRIVG